MVLEEQLKKLKESFSKENSSVAELQEQHNRQLSEQTKSSQTLLKQIHSSFQQQMIDTLEGERKLFQAQLKTSLAEQQEVHQQQLVKQAKALKDSLEVEAANATSSIENNLKILQVEMKQLIAKEVENSTRQSNALMSTAMEKHAIVRVYLYSMCNTTHNTTIIMK
eukprot:m.27354 g.27354  ORF g.27354 m.27354 type:complete len:166 (-) comp9345_c0_seq2:27-524(-)